MICKTLPLKPTLIISDSLLLAGPESLAKTDSLQILYLSLYDIYNFKLYMSLTNSLQLKASGIKFI